MPGASQSLSLIAAEAGFDGDRLGQVNLVMEELFMNVARYAYPSGAQGMVEVSYSVPQPGLLAVEIADRGEAFDPLSREEPDLTASLEDRPIGGLGIFLVRSMTSGLCYRRDGGLAVPVL